MAQGVPGLQQLQQMRGSDVIDSSGEKVGKLEDIYVDRDTGQPEWAGIKKGMMGSSHVLVPLSGATSKDGSITVAVGKDRVDSAPDISEEEISDQTEQQLYRHYGLPQGGRASRDAQPRGRSTDANRDDDSITLHEERLDVSKRQVPAGTARLRKYVESDRVEQDVPLRSEHAEVHRERVDQPAPGARFGEDSAEVDLQREEAVVDKETYATERVSLDKQSDVSQQHVSEEVRRERAEIEGDQQPRRSARGKDEPNV